MANNDTKMFGTAFRDLPNKYTDASETPIRTSSRGDLVVQPLGKARYTLANEGSYFLAASATPGTGIATIAATGVFSDLETFIIVRNTAAVSSGTRVFLDYVKLNVTVAGTNGVDVRYTTKTDKGGTRYTSGVDAAFVQTPINVNMDSTAASVCNVKAGPLITTAATTDAKLLGCGLIRTVIGVVGDTYVFNFGGEPAISSGLAEGTLVLNTTIPHCPVILGPEHSFFLSMHHTSQTVGTSYQVEVGFWER